MKNRRNKISKKPSKTRNILNAAKLASAMLVAGVLTTPQDSFSQTNRNANDISIEKVKLDTTISLSDYMEMLKKRDEYISKNWTAKTMTQKEYFLLNQKELFEQHIERNTNGARDKLDEIKDLLNTKFGNNFDNSNNKTNYNVSVIKTALKIIAEKDSIKGLQELANKIGSEFDEDFINAYGYLQVLNKSLVTGYYGSELPMIELSKPTLTMIARLLDDIDIHYYEAKNVYDNKNKKTQNDDQGNRNNQDIDDDNESYDRESDTSTKEEDKTSENKEEKIKEEINKEESKQNPTPKKEMESDPNKQNIDDDESYDRETPKTNKKDIIENKQGQEEEKQKTNKIEKKIEENRNIINYDFKNNLDYKLGHKVLKEKINDLKIEYPVIERFVNDLSKIGINYEKGDKTTIYQTSLILDFINGDYESGYKSLDSVIVKGQKGSVAILTMLKDLRHNYNTENFQKIQIVNAKLWNDTILSKYLDKNNLDNISYQDIIDVVNGFKSDNLQKAFMYALLDNDIKYAQELMGLGNRPGTKEHYSEYLAGEKIGKEELKKIKKAGEYRKHMEQDEIIPNKGIPQDVKDAYMDFVNGEKNNDKKPYGILSKTDMKLYMFSNKNILLSRESTLIGKHKGDKPNNPPQIKTTPAEMYMIGEAFSDNEAGKNMFDMYGSHYILLIPLKGQYNKKGNKTIGIHAVYIKEEAQRTKAINSKNRTDHMLSAGCINILSKTFGEIFNHFPPGTMFFVTDSPSKADLETYTKQIQK